MDGATRRSAMLAANPAYIPRNHRVEAVIRAAVDDDDFAPFYELVAVLSRPFDAQLSLSSENPARVIGENPTTPPS